MKKEHKTEKLFRPTAIITEDNMATLAAAASLDELKSLYRHYAAILHPDRGGSTSRMQNLNHQYRIMKKRLKQAANDERPLPQSFADLCVGDQLYVNATRVEVLEIKEQTFRVVAVGRSRQATFNKHTGLGRNPRLRASFYPLKKPARH
ncbi:hypothetical protein imdm_1925 [gamma proteobacterium IMCC2047]|nr:hypothetical protein imdm_1925 [gamma proteobacterium IMCC2047]